ncbi:MAG TPA: DUF6600 domain-containing protein [Xanthomonadaceae bacterium]|nr:DUF6600 domain-containing protein [Xanthomonadaceae bacterium]
MSQRIIAGLFAATFAVAATLSPAQAAHDDPPTRVARLAYVTGDASFSPAGERDWYRPVVNRPLYRGDRVWTDRRGRIELQVGGAAVRLDQYSSLQVLEIGDDFAQFELTEGTLNLGVHHLYEGQVYEIATPMLALVISEPGSYRVQVDNRGATDVIVWRGRAEAYGEGTSFPLRDGDAVTFFDARLRDYQFYRVPRPDSFDRFVLARDDRLLRSPSRRYVSDGMIGYADLDEYGSWRQDSSYGQVWYPRSVPSGWAPYRHGHWIWQEPWGWTWVDDMPWGFAPSHYGRWVHVGSRWGWTPGPRHHRPVYAPAMVAFFGGSGLSVSLSLGSRPVGWFPLGPRDVYVPGYQVSRDYFTRVNSYNTTVINNTSITNIYNNYYVRDSDFSRLDYAYRGSRDAVTAVPADVFTQGRPVAGAALSPARFDTARAEVRRLAPVTPVAQSLTGAETTRMKPSREIEERRVVARRAPPAAVATLPGRRVATDEVQRQVRVLGEPSRRVDRADVERVREAAVARGQERVQRAPTPAAAGEDERRSRGVPQRQDEDVRARQARPPERGRSAQVREDDRQGERVRADERQAQEARDSRGRSAEAAAQRDAEQARAGQERAAQVQARDRQEAADRGREADAERQRAERAEQAEQAERAEQVERSNRREAAARNERAEQQRIAAERDRETAQRQRAAERERSEAAEAERGAERARATEQQQRQEAQARERQAEAARERASRAEAAERQQAQQRAEQARQQQQAREAQQRAEQARQQQQAREAQHRAEQARQQQQAREAQQQQQAREAQQRAAEGQRQQQALEAQQRAEQARQQQQAREAQERAAEARRQQEENGSQPPARGRSDREETDEEEDEREQRGRGRGERRR